MLPFIVEQFDICDFPEAEPFIDYVLRAGKAIVLFDGLDEVKQEDDQQLRLTRLLRDFTEKYDNSQHVITCRIAASEYAFPHLDDLEVADFTDEQVTNYAQNVVKPIGLWLMELDKLGIALLGYPWVPLSSAQ